jgi:hypothetical protein
MPTTIPTKNFVRTLVWRKFKLFARVEKPVIHYLSADEARRLVNACPPDFRRLVQAALLKVADIPHLPI